MLCDAPAHAVYNRKLELFFKFIERLKENSLRGVKSTLGCIYNLMKINYFIFS